MITKFAGGRLEKLHQFKALLLATYWHHFSPSVIICKLMAFQNAPFPVGYVSHVYFEEASLAMQYSTMMCIAWLTPKTAHQVIFNGDICQLCPQVDWFMGESSMVTVAGVLDGFATWKNSLCLFYLLPNYWSHPVMVNMFTHLTYWEDNIELIAGAP
uniref:Uncharacterized protein n=1 Tax=Plectus sambesii TaxID=2011161 RepID=A0A914W2C9_9BILA